tara:strand:- start:621 stop:1097 length:477 start_codon:yes stop_codon:yes gene_type:complete
MNFVKHLRRLTFFYFFIILFLFISQTKSNAQLKTNNKTISGSGQFGGTSIIGPKPSEFKNTTKKITYLAVSDHREWTNDQGKIIKARLIAFDSGDKQKFIPPTIIKDKNIRMLVGQKPYIFPLSKLNEVNQKEIVELNNGFKAHYKRVQQTQKKKNSK